MSDLYKKTRREKIQKAWMSRDPHAGLAVVKIPHIPLPDSYRRKGECPEKNHGEELVRYQFSYITNNIFV